MKPTDRGSDRERVGSVSSPDEGPSPDEPKPPSLAECTRNLTDDALRDFAILCNQAGEGFLQIGDRTTVHSLRDPRTKLMVTREAATAGTRMRPAEQQALMEDLRGYAALWGLRRDAWHAIAPIEGGFERDLCHEDDTRVRVTAEGVVIHRDREGPLFFRPPTMRPQVTPAEEGDYDAIDAYLQSVPFHERVLLKLWISYTISLPRVPSSVFVIALLAGPQGSGKSLISQILASLIYPCDVVLQAMPRTPLDLAIAVQHSSLCLFDNVRSVSARMSDALCMSSTGRVITGRRLYSDDAQSAVSIHGAILLNSLHGGVVREADLAERCLQLALRPIDASKRQDAAEILQRFERDRPIILGGLLRYVSRILARLPQAQPTNPARVFAFSKWLAAAELVDGVPEGSYQEWYRENLAGGMLDTLTESPIASALLDFVDAQPEGRWSGTAAELLEALTFATRNAHGPGWPVNEIALARRLRALVAAFRAQDIDLRFTRGRQRTITITRAVP